MDTRVAEQVQRLATSVGSSQRAGALQRKCSCGSHTPGGADCESCKQERLQRKVNIGASNDPLEQEADRVADRVMTMSPSDRVSATPPRIQPAAGQAAGDAGTAPASVNRVLAYPGRPLDPTLQQDMEQRFGYDFSHVRLHTDALAQQSALDVNAHAYTVGHNIVFGAGQHSSDSSAGKRLLAHELAHVVQQMRGEGSDTGSTALERGRGSSPNSARIGIDSGRRMRPHELAHVVQLCGARSPILQRLAYCTIPRMSLRECPPRESGEITRAASTPMGVLPTNPPDRGLLVGNFAVGKSTIKANVLGNYFWKEFVAQMERQQHYRWEILGFTDCEGPASLNRKLRQSRADAVYGLLPPAAQRTVTSVKAAEEDQCITPNETPARRNANRSVLIRFVGGYRDINEEPTHLVGVDPLTRCRRGERGFKTFPYRSSYSDSAPIDAERASGKIHVEVPIHTWLNPKFRDDVRTLPGPHVDLSPDEIVRVHYYKDNFNKHGDRQDCVTGQQMLDVAQRSTWDTYRLGWKLGKKAWNWAKHLL